MRLHDFLEYRARTEGDAELIKFESQRVSAREADRRANKIANALMASGVAPGDRIAILSKNRIELLLTYYAASKAGIVLVPINYRLAPPEWQYILNDSGVKLILADGDCADQLEYGSAAHDRGIRRVAFDRPVDGWESWEDWTTQTDTTPPDFDPAPTDVLYQMYTSGTTGRPKGAVITQQALCSNILQEFPVFAMRAGERALLATPLFHSAGAILAFSAIAMSGSLVIHREFDASAVVGALDTDRIGVTLLVPAMIQFCLDVSGVRERKFESLHRIAYGASPISVSVLKDAMKTFGCEFAQGYGLTEATSLVTALLPADHDRALREKPDLLLSCGRAALGTIVRIVDEDGNEAPPGEVGEVTIRGPQLFREYWNLPEATTEALKDGWLHTGDGGLVDDEGYLYLKDRLKDMIISGGENVYPREVEEILFQHDQIADAAVIGLPDDQWGEVVIAVVVVRDGGTIPVDEIVDFCRTRIAGYKRPRSVEFVAELPRNASGKVLKRELRETFARR